MYKIIHEELENENVQFFVAGSAGPFRITSQEDSSTWSVGSEQVITWDVANTDDPDSVNCQTVDIYLSIDAGINFDYLLANLYSLISLH